MRRVATIALQVQKLCLKKKERTHTRKQTKQQNAKNKKMDFFITQIMVIDTQEVGVNSMAKVQPKAM